MAISPEDLGHLRRCVELAREALEAGDEPFGSVLVSADGAVRFEDRNRVGGGDETRHPELEIARWAAGHLDAAERATSVVYTSGEHCPMCSAGHAWVGLDRIVYAVSTARLSAWREAWGAPPPAVLPLPIGAVARGLPVDGPVDEVAPELVEELRVLHRRRHDATAQGRG